MIIINVYIYIYIYIYVYMIILITTMIIMITITVIITILLTIYNNDIFEYVFPMISFTPAASRLYPADLLGDSWENGAEAHPPALYIYIYIHML